MAYNILIIDDQEDICALISNILKDEGYICRIATNSQQAMDEIRHQLPHLIILDIWLNDSHFDGIEILDTIKQTHTDLPVVMISGHSNIETAVNALKKGADDSIEKPFKTEKLLHIVHKIIEKYALKKELQSLKQQLHIPLNFYGTPQHVQYYKQQIEKIAKTNSRVLIEGSPGTGKKFIAKLIHQHSNRSNHPFIVVNCAAIESNRFEEDFLGIISKNIHGIASQLGYLEKANGGSLFLDNITDLSLEAQGKLLSLLQNKNFIRVGGTKEIQLDFRVIAASNISVKQQIDGKKFREDLYYRLAVIPITMLLLNDIPENIIPIAMKILEEFNLQSTFSKEAIFLLESYQWQGNIRQLRNVIEWICIMYPEINGDMIQPKHLPTELSQETVQKIDQNINTHFLSLPLREAREEFEKIYLNMHIKRFNGNITKTAHAIGMERTALHRKLKLLNFSDENSL